MASPTTGPVVVAVDGRSGAGKTTVAAELADRMPGSIVVHTDDVAWNHSAFGWDQLLVENLLEPVVNGVPVDFTPPAWTEHGRQGSIGLLAGASVLLLEGVGASRKALTPWLDATVWVQSDVVEARERGVARDIELGRTPEQAEAFWDEWEAEEVPFLDRDQPWCRASQVVCGSRRRKGFVARSDE